MKTHEEIIRVAAVQMDFNLAANLGINYLEEPANLKEGEKGITSLRLSEQKLMNHLKRFRQNISENYSRMLNRKLEHILRLCAEKKVDLLVFPEYSIPASCLEILKSYSKKGISIIGGSHSVLNANQGFYGKVDLRIGTKDEGKSICPIFFADGRTEHIEKLTRSKFESKIKLGDKWELKWLEKNGFKFMFPVFLCIDFIHDTDTYRSRFMNDTDFRSSDFIVVFSYSPVVKDFENKAWSIITRYYKPVIYTNAMMGGGSKIFCHFDKKDPFVDNSGSFQIPEGEEAVLIVDLNVRGQFTRKPTSYENYFTSKQVGLIPLLYDNILGYEDFMHIYMQSNLDQKRTLIINREDEIFNWFGKSETLKTKLMEVINNTETLDEEDIDYCMESLVFPKNLHSLNEWRFENLAESLSFLKDIGEKCNPKRTN